MKEEIVDPSMDIAYTLAKEIGDSFILPKLLKYPKTVTEYLDEMDEIIAQVGVYYEVDDVTKNKIINNISDGSKIYMDDIKNSNDRVNLTLRLWSGCLDAAKTIAMETRNGPNTPKIRTKLFKNSIDIRAKDDEVYAYGVSIAPLFKERRKQPISFKGVPKNSQVKKFFKKQSYVKERKSATGKGV